MTTATRSEIIRAFLPASPFAQQLGLSIERLDAEGAELRMPYDPALATFGDTVHGGAIASLIDTAGMVAAWGDDEPSARAAGATVSMSVDYVAAARASDLIARARVVRRGRSLCFMLVEVVDDDERVVATGQVCHRFAPLMPAAPPRRTQAERRAQTRAKLLKAAGAVFARRGYHEATLDEIADRAGLSKGALYYNFASKEDLFLALLADRLDARLGDAAGAGPRAFEAFVAALERDPRWAPLFFEFVAWSGRDARRRARLRERFILPAREHTRAVVAAEASPFSPDELATIVNALVNGLLLERLFDPEGVPGDLVTRALIVLTGAEFGSSADG